jgi:hypothetical protein
MLAKPRFPYTLARVDAFLPIKKGKSKVDSRHAIFECIKAQTHGLVKNPAHGASQKEKNRTLVHDSGTEGNAPSNFDRGHL